MKVVMTCLLVLAMSGFVFAAGSETSAEFNVGTAEIGKDYVPSTAFWDLYGDYVIWAVVILVVLVILFKMKGKKSKGKSKKVVKKVSAKKVSHKKVVKKKSKK